MDENQKQERVKLMAQVLIDKKNSGKVPYEIAKLAKTNVRELKKISYKFKEVFGSSIHFAPGLQLIFPPDQLEMVNFVENKVLEPQEKSPDKFTSIDHIAVMLLTVMFFRKGKITEPQLKKIFSDKLDIAWDKPDSLHGAKSAKMIIAKLEKDNIIRKISVNAMRISTQTQIDEAQTERVAKYEIGVRAKHLYDWDKIFEAGIRNLEIQADQVLTPGEVKRMKLQCKQVLDDINDEKWRERYKSAVYNEKPENEEEEENYYW